MNKVAARAAALLIFVLILTGGLIFFLGFNSIKAKIETSGFVVLCATCNRRF